ncbi:MAG: DinB family protein [Armatimonadota bacterium]|nr:DinB family protein [Armatimonadota bacterium]
MTVKALVLKHLEMTYEKGPGQPSVRVALEGLTAQQAAWKPAPERHSIWQIVRHLVRWKQAIYEDWHGRRPDYAAIDQGDWAEATGDEAAWRRDLEALEAISQQYKAYLLGVSDEDLGREVPGLGVLAVSIMEMGTHDIYHAGQIRHLRALQGV